MSDSIPHIPSPATPKLVFDEAGKFMISAGADCLLTVHEVSLVQSVFQKHLPSEPALVAWLFPHKDTSIVACGLDNSFIMIYNLRTGPSESSASACGFMEERL